MQDPEQEPKQTVSDTIDSFFAKNDATGGEEQPQDNAQPETEQPVETPEDGSDPVKTPSTESPDSFKGVDKGFANHPKWIEREQKLKEAEAKATQFETNLSRLLDDPLVYKKYLETQGYSKEEISQAMAQRGFVEEQKPSMAPAAQDIAEATCKKLGWDISRLNGEQKAYINDQIRLIQAVAEDLFGKAQANFEQRLKPLEGFVQQGQIVAQINKEYSDVVDTARNEFPEIIKTPEDFEKIIKPAMDALLDELDAKDPQKNISIDARTLYERATRQLLKEKKLSEERQEVREGLKKNAKPLMPRTPIPVGDRKDKGKSARETANAFLNSIGVKD